MNHKSISTAIKRTLTFMLAFAMIATSLYVAPAASAEELNEDEIILDGSSEEIIEEEIIGEGEAEDADKFEYSHGDIAGKADEYYLLVNPDNSATDMNLEYDDAGNMAAALISAIEGTDGTDGVVVFGMYTENDGDIDETTKKAIAGEFEGNETNNDPENVYYFEQIGTTTIDGTSDEKYAASITSAFEAVKPLDKLSVVIRVDEVVSALGKEGAHTERARGTFTFPVVYGTGAIAVDAASPKTYTVDSNPGSQTSDLLDKIIATGVEATPMVVKSAKADGTLQGDALTLSKSTTTNGGYVASVEYVTVGGKTTYNGEGTDANDIINKLAPGATAKVGVQVRKYSTSSPNYTRAATAKDEVDLTIKTLDTSVSVVSNTTEVSVNKNKGATMKEEIEDELAKVASEATASAIQVQTYNTGNGAVVEDTKKNVYRTLGTEATLFSGTSAKEYTIEVATQEDDLAAMNADDSATVEYSIYSNTSVRSSDEESWGDWSKATDPCAYGQITVRIDPVAGSLKVTNTTAPVIEVQKGEHVDMLKDLTDGLLEEIAIDKYASGWGHALNNETDGVKAGLKTAVGTAGARGKEYIGINKVDDGTNNHNDASGDLSALDVGEYEVDLRVDTLQSDSEAYEATNTTGTTCKAVLKVTDAEGTVVASKGLEVEVNKAANAEKTVDAVKAELAKKISASIIGEEETYGKYSDATVVASTEEMKVKDNYYWLVGVTENSSNIENANPTKGIGVRVSGATYKVSLYKGTKDVGEDENGEGAAEASIASENIDFDVIVRPVVGSIESVKIKNNIHIAEDKINAADATKSQAFADLKAELENAVEVNVFKADGTTEQVTDKLYYSDQATATKAYIFGEDTTLSAETLYYVYEVTTIGGNSSATTDATVSAALAHSSGVKTRLPVEVTVKPYMTNDETTVGIDSTATGLYSAKLSTSGREVYVYPKYRLASADSGKIILSTGNGVEDVQNKIAAKVETFEGVDDENNAIYSGSDGEYATDAEMKAGATTKDEISWQLKLGKTIPVDGTGDEAKTLKEAETTGITVSATAYIGDGTNAAAVSPAWTLTNTKSYDLSVLADGKLAAVKLTDKLDNGITISGNGKDVNAKLAKLYANEYLIKSFTIEEMVSGAQTAVTDKDSIISAVDYAKKTNDDKKDATFYVWTIKGLSNAEGNYNCAIEVKKYVFDADGKEDKAKGSSTVAESGTFKITVGPVDGKLVPNQTGGGFTVSYTTPSALAEVIVDRVLSAYDKQIYIDGEAQSWKARAEKLGSLSEGEYEIVYGKITIDETGKTGIEYKTDNMNKIGAAIKTAYQNGKTIDVKVALESFGYVSEEKPEVSIDKTTYTETVTIDTLNTYTATLTVYRDSQMRERYAAQTVGYIERGKVIGSIRGTEVGAYADQIDGWFKLDANGNLTNIAWDLATTPVNEDVDLAAFIKNGGKALVSGGTATYASAGVKNAAFNNKVYKPVPVVNKTVGDEKAVLAKNKSAVKYYDYTNKIRGAEVKSPKNAGMYLAVVTDKTDKRNPVEVMECPFEIEKVVVNDDNDDLKEKVGTFKAGKVTKIAAVKSFKVNKQKLTYGKDKDYIYTTNAAASDMKIADDGKIEVYKAGVYTVEVTINEKSVNFKQEKSVAKPSFTVNVQDANHQLKNAKITLDAKSIGTQDFDKEYMDFTVTTKDKKGVLYAYGDTTIGEGSVQYKDADGDWISTSAFDVTYTPKKGWGNPGKVTVTITANAGNPLELSGSKTFTYNITASKKLTKSVFKDAAPLDLAGHKKAKDIVYTGNEWTLEDIIKLTPKTAATETTKAVYYNDLEVIDEINKLMNGPIYNKDFTIQYSKNIDAGTATATFVALDSSAWTGSFKVTFNIQKANLANVYDAPIDPDTKKPVPNDGTIILNKAGLGIPEVKGTEADKWTYKGKGNGQKYELTAAGLNGLVENEKMIDVTGAAYKTGDIYDKDGQLVYTKLPVKAGVDYTVSYKDNKVSADKPIKITLTGKGNYTGKIPFEVARTAGGK